ncbi:hypothetical protein [Micromonospora chersina]
MGIAASAPARRTASQPASWAPLRPPRNRPKITAPAALGRVYAATAIAVQVPRCPGGARCSASQVTATSAMPSPRADTASPGSTRRSNGWLTTGQ